MRGAGCPCAGGCTPTTNTRWQEGVRAERHVSHLHYTAWPDHGIPESTTSIMTFRELVREQIQSTKDAGPTLVHCR